MNWLVYLCRKTPLKVMDEQIFEAGMAALEHEAAAEHHQALAEMYRKREKRLADRKNSINKEIE